MVASTAQDRGSSLIREPGEFLSLREPHRRSFKLWMSYALRIKGINGGKSAQDVFRTLLNARVCFVLNSRSLQAERALGCALDRRMGPDVVGNWSREKSCLGALMAVETGNKDQGEELEEGYGCRIVKNSFCFLPFVLLPCPAVVFMNCFLISLF